MLKKLFLVFPLMLFINSANAGYSDVVKITAIESQGSDVSIYVDNGAVPQNPGNCQSGSANQIFLNNDEGLARTYSAALSALATQSNVQLLLSAGACRYSHRVLIGIRVVQ